jgi:hypothetical protein
MYGNRTEGSFRMDRAFFFYFSINPLLLERQKQQNAQG